MSSATGRPDASTDSGTLRPSAGHVFVGRERELAAFQQALSDCTAGRGRVLMLVGDPGIGKTRTAAEFAVIAEHAGARILRGACYEGEWMPPYGPFAEALTEYVRSADPAQLRKDLGPAASPIARFVPALRECLPDVSGPAVLPPHEERYQLFDAVARFVTAVSARQPLMLLLDDLHWADRGTLALFRYVSRSLRRHPILLVGAYRSLEVDRAHPLTEVIGALRRESTFSPLVLSGLSDTDTANLIAALTPASVPPALLAAIGAHTQGNPFFIREIIQHYVDEAARRGQPAESMADLGVPDSIRHLIERRLSRMSFEANRLLTVAALFDGPFRYDVAATVAKVGPAAALAIVDDALRARVIRSLHTPDVYDFSHALIRHALSAALSSSRRVRLQRQLAEKMAARQERLGTDLSAEIAYQYYQSAVLPGAEDGVPYAVAAADHAERAAGWDRAATFLNVALQLLPESDPRRPRLLARRGVALARAMEFKAALTVSRQAAEAIATTEGASAAADYITDVIFAFDAGFGRGAFELARLGLEYIGSRRDITWARLRLMDLIRRGFEDPDCPGLPPDTREWRELVWVALELKLIGGGNDIEDVPNPDGFLYNDEELRTALELAEKYERLNRPARAAIHWSTVFRIRTALGRFAGAREARQRLLALAARLPAGSIIGRFGSAAEDEWKMARDEDWDTDRSAPSRDDPTRKQTADAQTDRRVADWRDRATIHASIARIHARMGRSEHAMRRLSSVVRAIDECASWSENYIRVVCDAAETLWLTKRTDYAEVIERNLREKVVVTSATYPMMDGRLALARVCAVQHRYDEAREWFARARQALDLQGARPLRAIVDYDEALMYHRRDAPGDREGALPLLNAAIEQFRAIDMPGWIRRAETLLREGKECPSTQAAASPATSPRAEVPPAHTEALCQREGEYWTMRHRGNVIRLRHRVGMTYIARLLEHPHEQISALDLEGFDAPAHADAREPSVHHGHQPGDLGDVLDPQARAEYRQRLEDLQAEIADAEQAQDLGRAEHARTEHETLREFLSRALGLGGRARRIGSPVERSRVRVTRAIRKSIRHIKAENRQLGDHLERSIRTGTFCCYAPSEPVVWTIAHQRIAGSV